MSVLLQEFLLLETRGFSLTTKDLDIRKDETPKPERHLRYWTGFHVYRCPVPAAQDCCSWIAYLAESILKLDVLLMVKPVNKALWEQ